MSRYGHLPLVLSGEEVCELLGVSRATLRRMVERGEFDPPLSSGGRALRWARESVTRYLAQAQEDTRVNDLIAILVGIKTDVEDVIEELEHL